MLIALEDDGVVRVYETVEAAVREVEALDAEETFRAVFDEDGQVFEIEWTRPNKSGWLAVENGAYTLRPTGRLNVEGLLSVLTSARGIDPIERENDVRDIQTRLSRR